MESTDNNIDYCITCLKVGDLFCCDNCPRSFHGSCLPSGSPDTEKWKCHFCIKDESASEPERITWQSSYIKLRSISSFPKIRKHKETICSLREIVIFLMRYHFGEVFSIPVDVQKHPDYLNVVREPMYLQKILTRLNNGFYFSRDDCIFSIVQDVNIIWDNCFKYNIKGSLIYRMAAVQKRKFEKLLRHYVNISVDNSASEELLECTTKPKKLPQRAKKIIENTTTVSAILEQLGNLTNLQCCVCLGNDDLITLPPCQCTTKLVEPSSAKCFEKHCKTDLNQALKVLKFKSYKHRIVCRSCGEQINKAAQDVVESDYCGQFSVRRKCPICPQHFSPRSIEKILNKDLHDEMKESINQTIKILNYVKCSGPGGALREKETAASVNMNAVDNCQVDDTFNFDLDSFTISECSTINSNNTNENSSHASKQQQQQQRQEILTYPSIAENEIGHSCRSHFSRVAPFGDEFSSCILDKLHTVARFGLNRDVQELTSQMLQNRKRKRGVAEPKGFKLNIFDGVRTAFFLKKDDFVEELRRVSRKSRKLKPFVTHDQVCHICHHRRPNVIVFNCPSKSKHAFCEKHAKSRLGIENLTLQEIAPKLHYCPICCFECECAKCVRYLDSLWKEKNEALTPEIIINCSSDDDKEQSKAITSDTTSSQSSESDKEKKEAMTPAITVACSSDDDKEQSTLKTTTTYISDKNEEKHEDMTSEITFGCSTDEDKEQSKPVTPEATVIHISDEEKTEAITPETTINNNPANKYTRSGKSSFLCCPISLILQPILLTDQLAYLSFYCHICFLSRTNQQ